MLCFRNLRALILKRECSTLVEKPWLQISEEVRAAVNEKRGVVALESTVITHGMPYPANLKVAEELESVVRQNDCVPATIALLNGKIHVGLNNDQLHFLANSQSAQKVSRRDLPLVLSKGSIGGTTVSATMICARLAEISVFATGGIGGVHRGAQETFDVSADLTELGRTPVAVVCAGVKSILDIPKTLEYLETQGVPVITFAENNDFPGFFTRNSGCKSPYYFKNENDIASAIYTLKSLNLNNGILIAVPIPVTETSNGELIAEAIDKALHESKTLKISGKDITPFILKRVNELTSGLSLSLNTLLIKNNAVHAAKIAYALSRIESNKCDDAAEYDPKPEKLISKTTSLSEVVVVGGAIVDFYLKTDQDIKMDGRTHPGIITQVCGGVGRNHADALTRLGIKSLLVSSGGEDQLKSHILNSCSHMDMQGIQWHRGKQTASYAGIVEKNKLAFGVGSMDVFTAIDETWVANFKDAIQKCKLCVMDGNIPVQTMSFICDICSTSNIPVWFDPADCSKVGKILDADCFDKITYFSPNWNEFLFLTKQLNLSYDRSCLENYSVFYDRIVNDFGILMPAHLQCIFITLGERGVIVLNKSQNRGFITHFKAPIVDDLTNVSGSGDCFNSGIIFGLLNNYSCKESVSFGLECAVKSLKSIYPVPANLTLLNLQNIPPPVIMHDQEFSL